MDPSTSPAETPSSPTGPTETMHDLKPEAQFEQMAATISPATPEELLNRTLGGLSRLNLTGLVSFNRSAQSVIGLGHSGDVYRGTYEVPGRAPVMVAVKVLRYTIADSDVITKVTAKEVYIWSKLDHLNLLPLSGFVFLEGASLPSLVSELMGGGPVLKYVQSHPECDVIHLINGIAEGLAYLHKNDVVHSDIKSDNILVSASGDSVICDFGISRAMNFTQKALGGNTTLPNGPGGTSRWMAYELIVDSKNYKKPSKESDAWAFGITVSELLTKNLPYVDIHMDLQVLLFVAGGGHPVPPKTFDTWPESMRNIWGICESCWIKDPKERITMTSAVEQLGSLIRVD